MTTTPTPGDVLARARERLAGPGWYVPRISDGDLLEDLAAEVVRLRAANSIAGESAEIARLAAEVAALRTQLDKAERSKSALVAKVKRLENRLAVARGALPARDVRQGWADAVARADVAEAEVDALRRALTPDLETDGELIAAHDTHRPVCATCGGSRFKPWKLLSDDDVVGALRAICDRTGTSIPCPDCTEDINHAEG